MYPGDSPPMCNPAGELSKSKGKLNWDDSGEYELLKAGDHSTGVKISSSGDSDPELEVVIEIRAGELGNSTTASSNCSAIYSLSFA